MPPSDRDVDKERVDLNAQADPSTGLRRDQRGPAAQKRLVDRLLWAGVVQHGPPHALDRFLGSMFGFGVLPTGRNGPKRRLLAVPGPVALLSDSVPTGLVLPVVVALAHRTDPDRGCRVLDPLEFSPMIRVACRNDGRGTLTSKTAGCDQGATKFLPQVLGGDRSLAFGDLLDALDARLDHVEVGEPLERRPPWLQSPCLRCPPP
jgi:hypothetical protein